MFVFRLDDPGCAEVWEGEAGRGQRDWRAKNAGGMQGGGASQTALVEVSAQILGSAT